MIRLSRKVLPVLIVLFLSCVKVNHDSRDISIVKDSMNREITMPATISGIICSGAGALRYITYMQCQEKVTAVDDLERKGSVLNTRPYAIANPRFTQLRIFGAFRGHDNPELIVALHPKPDLIFKTYADMGFNPAELQEKTGIPVFVLDYGDLGTNIAAFYKSIDLIGQIMNKEERAVEIKRFIDNIIADLENRTGDITEHKSCYIGGVAYKGPLGLQSTEPGYPPFVFLNTPNAAANPANRELAHMNVSKEKIVEWDPEIIFIDLATFQSDPVTNALYELKTDPAYTSLTAVKTGNIYGVLPYNSYTQNHGSTLANAYFIGKILYPENFVDIEPAKKADEIYTFLAGKPVFKEMNESFNEMAYTKLGL